MPGLHTNTAAQRIPALATYGVPILVVVSMFLPRIPHTDYEVDTGLYAGLAWHMVREGTWLTPMAGDLPYFNKPPLALWFHALAMTALGPSLTAILSIQLLVACGAVAANTLAASSLLGRRIALLSGIQIATTLSFFLYADRFILDYWIVLFFGLALWCAAQARRAVRPAPWCVGVGVWIGLAMLVKPLFPLLTPVFFALALRWIGRRRAAAWMLLAVPIALLVAAPWHIAMYALHAESFLDQYLGREVVQRAAGERFGNQSWLVLPRMIGMTGLPWSVLLLGVAIELIRRRFPVRSHLFRFALVWWIGFTVLLALFGDKRSRYFTHVWPPVTMVTSVWLVQRSREWRAVRWAFAPRTLTWFAPSLLVLSGVLTATRAIPGDAPAPEWERLYAFLRAHPGDDIWQLSLWPPLSGQIYLNTGIWPKATNNWDAVNFRAPPPGALGITRPEHGVPLYPDETVVFEEGRLRVIRLGTARARPAPSPTP